MQTSTVIRNSVVHQHGNASIGSGQYCLWETACGTVSTLIIANSSRVNTLYLGIIGTPDSGIRIKVNGQSKDKLNGFYEIPPNTTTYVIEAYGDFKGKSITITNNTNIQIDTSAKIQVQTTEEKP